MQNNGEKKKKLIEKWQQYYFFLVNEYLFLNQSVKYFLLKLLTTL